MLKDVRQHGDTTVVEVGGRLDASTAPDAKAQLADLIASGQCKLVLNLKNVEFIDSSGLGLLVSCLRRCVAAGGDLCLAEVPELARSVLELTRLTRVFRIEASEAEAVQNMGAAHEPNDGQQ